MQGAIMLLTPALSVCYDLPVRCFFIRIPLVVAFGVVKVIILIASLRVYLGRLIPMQCMLWWQHGQVRVDWLGGSIPSSNCSSGSNKH